MRERKGGVEIQPGERVPFTACPREACGPGCELCGGERVVPRFVRERYLWPTASGVAMGR